MSLGWFVVVLGSVCFLTTGWRHVFQAIDSVGSSFEVPVSGLYDMYQEAQGMANEMLMEVKMQKVKRGLNKLSLEELLDAQTLYGGEEGFKELVSSYVQKRQREAAEAQEALRASAGADEATKEKSRKLNRDEWARQCDNGLKVKFVKTSAFDESFDELTEGFSPEQTLLAFDMDGTLSWMKEKYTAATLETLRGKAQQMDKVVITARRNDRVSGCDVVLQTLVRDEAGSDIKELFGLPDACSESDRLWPNGPLAMQGLVMNEYAKAEGLVAYVRKGLASNAEHVVFYDDFVSNPVSMAYHLCRTDKWPELKQVTAVWYATPEAELRDTTVADRVKRGEIAAEMHSEGSFFDPVAENDANLAGKRALFGVL